MLVTIFLFALLKNYCQLNFPLLSFSSLYLEKSAVSSTYLWKKAPSVLNYAKKVLNFDRCQLWILAVLQNCQRFLTAVNHLLKFSGFFNGFLAPEYKCSPTINFKIDVAVGVAFYAASWVYSLLKKILCSADRVKAFRCE
jgi:hypothetical protein